MQKLGSYLACIFVKSCFAVQKTKNWYHDIDIIIIVPIIALVMLYFGMKDPINNLLCNLEIQCRFLLSK